MLGCFVYESRLITDEYNDRRVMNDRQENRPLLTLVPYNWINPHLLKSSLTTTTGDIIIVTRNNIFHGYFKAVIPVVPRALSAFAFDVVRNNVALYFDK